MSWFDFMYPFLMGCALFIIPGLLVVLPLRMKAVDALGLSPALSVAVSGVSAIVAPYLGLGWSLWVPFAFGAVFAVVSFCISLVVRRYRQADHVGAYSLLKISDLWFYGAILLGGMLSGLNIVTAIGSPDYISQSFDVNFHINAIRFIEEHDNGSSLYLGAMSSADLEPAFYPGVWHGMASLIFEASGADIVGVTNTMSVLIGAVVWPISILHLARSIKNFDGPILLIIGAASAAFVAFPLMLMDWGVLYPNMLGIAVLPVGIAFLAQFFNLVYGEKISLTQILCLGFFVFIGITLSHPNVLMSLLVIMVPMLLTNSIVAVKNYSRGKIKVVFLVGSLMFNATSLGVIWYLFGVVRPDEEAGIWGPSSTSAQALGEVIANAPMARGSGWFITGLMLWGIILLLTQKNRLIWMPLAWGFIGFFYISARSRAWEDGRYWFTGVWYNDAYRLAAVLPIFAVLFIGIAIQFAITRIAKAGIWKPVEQRITWFNLPIRLITLGLIASILVTYYGQNSIAMTQYVKDIKGRYQISQTAGQVSLDEMWLLRNLDNYVPEDDTVIVIPHTGAALAYSISDREVTERHIFNSPNSDVLMIRENLNQANTKPDVCKAIDDLNAYYYLAFNLGDIYDNPNNEYIAETYPGLEDVEEQGVATAVARAGGAVLYEITACD